VSINRNINHAYLEAEKALARALRPGGEWFGDDELGSVDKGKLATIGLVTVGAVAGGFMAHGLNESGSQTALGYDNQPTVEIVRRNPPHLFPESFEPAAVAATSLDIAPQAPIGPREILPRQYTPDFSVSYEPFTQDPSWTHADWSAEKALEAVTKEGLWDQYDSYHQQLWKAQDQGDEETALFLSEQINELTQNIYLSYEEPERLGQYDESEERELQNQRSINETMSNALTKLEAEFNMAIETSSGIRVNVYVTPETGTQVSIDPELLDRLLDATLQAARDYEGLENPYTAAIRPIINMSREERSNLLIDLVLSAKPGTCIEDGGFQDTDRMKVIYRDSRGNTSTPIYTADFECGTEGIAHRTRMPDDMDTSYQRATVAVSTPAFYISSDPEVEQGQFPADPEYFNSYISNYVTSVTAHEILHALVTLGVQGEGVIDPEYIHYDGPSLFSQQSPEHVDFVNPVTRIIMDHWWELYQKGEVDHMVSFDFNAPEVK